MNGGTGSAVRYGAAAVLPLPGAGLLARLAARPALALTPLLPIYLAVTVLGQPSSAVAGDEIGFLYYAHRILHGSYGDPHAMDATALLWHGPAIPGLVAPFLAAGLPVAAVRFLMAPMLFAAVLVFHRLLRERLSPHAALAGALALGLYLPLYQSLRWVYKEPLAILLVCGGLLAMTRYMREGRRRQAVLAGLALAALVMVRLEYGWVVLALLAVCAVWWALRRTVDARRATAVMAIALAGCVPWLAYTYSLTHKPLYWGNSGGLSLYWMSPTGNGETGQWHGVHTVFDSARFAAYRPFFARVDRLPPVERDARLTSVARANIAAHPVLYARNLAANAARMWVQVPFWPRPAWLEVAMNVVFGGTLLMASGWAAAVLARRRRRLPPETLPIAAFAAVALVLHLLASADPRMTFPIVPALIWLVAQAAGRRRSVAPATR